MTESPGNAADLKAAEQVSYIRATRGWRDLELKRVWDYRELLFFLIWREVKGRYRQMALGPLWIILAPVMSMVVYTFIFSYLANISFQKPAEESSSPLSNLAYTAICIYAALLAWQPFAGAAGKSSVSLVGNMHLISKVYFPRLIIPISAAISGLLDFGMSFVILIGIMLAIGIVPTWGIVMLPLFIALAVLTGLAIGLWLACLAVKFRDVSYLVDYMLRLWMFATPVVYPAKLVKDKLEAAGWPSLYFVYRLNPMTGVVEGFRWALLGQGQPPDSLLFVSFVFVVILLIFGAFFFRRTEKSIVDLM
jgi:lipopolysaccharide transport system permease protein